LLADAVGLRFVPISAVFSGVADLKKIFAEAKTAARAGQRTLLFVDEIHRFNRAQQDILLPDVEAGHVILVGATTENPFFAVNAPLVSRSQIFQFTPISEEDIRLLVRRAVADKERGFGNLPIRIDDDALDLWATMSDGDARRALAAELSRARRASALSAPARVSTSTRPRTRERQCRRNSKAMYPPIDNPQSTTFSMSSASRRPARSVA